MEDITLKESAIEGLVLVKYRSFIDERGSFNRILRNPLLSDLKIEALVDCYLSRSRKNVLRGMHLMSKCAHEYKFVTCVSGKALDVLVDVRKESATYLECVSYSLSGDEMETICVPPGVAHGFLALKDKTEMLYHSTAVYKKENDLGVLWSSIGFNWGKSVGSSGLILSSRDKELPGIREFHYDQT